MSLPASITRNADNTLPLLALLQKTDSSLSTLAFEHLISHENGNELDEYLTITREDLEIVPESGSTSDGHGKNVDIRLLVNSLKSGTAIPDISPSLNLDLLIPILLTKFYDIISIRNVVFSVLRTTNPSFGKTITSLSSSNGHGTNMDPSLRMAGLIASSLIGIAPWSFNEVAESICDGLESATNGGGGNAQGDAVNAMNGKAKKEAELISRQNRAKAMLLRILADWGEYEHDKAVLIRRMLCSRRVGADVVLHITLRYIHDEVSFLSLNEVNHFISKESVRTEWLFQEMGSLFAAKEKEKESISNSNSISRSVSSTATSPPHVPPPPHSYTSRRDQRIDSSSTQSQLSTPTPVQQLRSFSSPSISSSSSDVQLQHHPQPQTSVMIEAEMASLRVNLAKAIRQACVERGSRGMRGGSDHVGAFLRPLRVWCKLWGVCGISSSNDEMISCLECVKRIVSLATHAQVHTALHTVGIRWCLCALLLCPRIVHVDGAGPVMQALLESHAASDVALISIYLSTGTVQPIATWIQRVMDLGSSPPALSIVNTHASPTSTSVSLVFSPVGLRELAQFVFTGNSSSSEGEGDEMVKGTGQGKGKGKVKGKDSVGGYWDEKVIVKRLVSSPIEIDHSLCATSSLHSTQSNSTVVLFHYLKQGAFTRHGVDPSPWIFKQILAASLPLHPLLVSLVELYSRECARNDVYQPLSRKDIVHACGNGGGLPMAMASRCLFIFHILTFQSSVSTSMSGVDVADREALDALGVGYVISTILDESVVRCGGRGCDRDEFEMIRAPLVGLVVSRAPYSMLLHPLLHREEVSSSTPSPSLSLSLPSLASAMASVDTNPIQARYALDMLIRSLPTLSLCQMRDSLFTVISSLVPIMVECDCDCETPANAISGIGPIFSRTWKAVAALAPDIVVPIALRVFVKLWNIGVGEGKGKGVFGSSDGMHNQHSEFEFELVKAVSSNPLSLLQCDRRVFRTPAVLGLWLHVFEYVSSMAKQCDHELLTEIERNRTRTRDKSVSEVNQTMADIRYGMKLHEAAAMQVLLDACKEQPGDGENIGVLDEVRTMICSYMHSTIINSPDICEILHRQCYSPLLVNMTVSRIPSMHICIGILPQLIDACVGSASASVSVTGSSGVVKSKGGQSTENSGGGGLGHESKLVFYALLTAELAKAYPIPASLAACQHIQRTLSQTSISESTLRRTAHAIVVMCSVFPELCVEYIRLLSGSGEGGTHHRIHMDEWRRNTIARIVDQTM